MVNKEMLEMTRDAIALIMSEASAEKNICYKKLGYYASVKDLIEKNTPAKTELKNGQSIHGLSITCPNCRKEINYYLIFSNQIGKKYCSYCGQKFKQIK